MRVLTSVLVTVSCLFMGVMGGAALAIPAIVYQINRSVIKVSDSPVDYTATTLVVVDHAPSNIQPILGSDGGDTDIQPALGANALQWHLTSATQQGLDINKAIQSGGLVWVRNE